MKNSYFITTANWSHMYPNSIQPLQGPYEFHLNPSSQLHALAECTTYIISHISPQLIIPCASMVQLSFEVKLSSFSPAEISSCSLVLLELAPLHSSWPVCWLSALFSNRLPRDSDTAGVPSPVLRSAIDESELSPGRTVFVAAACRLAMVKPAQLSNSILSTQLCPMQPSSVEREGEKK